MTLALDQLVMTFATAFSPAHSRRSAGSVSAEPLAGAAVAVGDVVLHVVDHGEGPPVLLLHGLPTSSYLWRNVQRGLVASCRTIAVDLVGLGASCAITGEALDLAGQAEHLGGLCDRLGNRRVLVVAHDVGAGVLYHLMQQRPELVAGAVLVDAIGSERHWPVPSVRALCLPWLGDLAVRIGPFRTVVARQLRRGAAPASLAPQVVERYLRPFEAIAGRRRFLDFVRTFDPAAVEGAITGLHAVPPVELLWGAHDVFQPLRAGDWLREQLHAPQVTVVQGGGHFLPETHPHVVVAAVKRALHRLGTDQRARAV